MHINQEVRSNGLANFFAQVLGLTGIGIILTSVLSAILAPLILKTGNLVVFMICSCLISFGLNIFIQYQLSSAKFNTLLLLSLALMVTNSITYSFVYIIGIYYGFDLVLTAVICTVVVFFVSAIYGMFTKKDLTQFSNIISIIAISLMVISLAGLLLSFITPMHYNAISIGISFISVIASTIFITYEINTLKYKYYSFRGDNDTLHRVSLSGALVLYTNFFSLLINLLNILIRLRRRD